MTDTTTSTPLPAQPSTDPRAALFVDSKQTIIAALLANDIACVTAEYDGEGDQGQVNTISAYDADNKEVPLDGMTVTMPADDKPTPLQEAIDDFAWAVLDAYHAGFENNDGGYGTLTISAHNDSVVLQHNDRFIDVHQSTEAF